MSTATAELKAIASMETAKFEAGVKRINTSIGTIASGQIKSLAGMIGGAFTVGAVVNFGKQILDSAVEIERMSDATGLSVRNVQILRNVALTSGVSFESMEGAIRRVNMQLGQGKMGVESSLVKWQALGKSFEDVKAMSPADAIKFLSEELQNAEPGSARFAEISELIGVKSVKAAVALREYAEAVKSGGTGGISIMTDEDVQRLADGAKYMRVLGEESKIAGAKTYSWAVDTLAKFYDINNALGKMLGLQYGGAEATKKLDWSKLTVNPVTAGKPKEAGFDLTQRDRELKKRMEGLTVPEAKAADRLAEMGGIIGGQTSLDQGAMALERKLDEISKKMDEQNGLIQGIGTSVQSGMGD